MEDKKAAKIARGKRAELLLKDELLAEALGKLEESYIAGWKLTPAKDKDARELLWLAVQVVGKVRDHLGKVMADGKLEQRELDALAPQSKRGIFGV